MHAEYPKNLPLALGCALPALGLALYAELAALQADTLTTVVAAFTAIPAVGAVIVGLVILALSLGKWQLGAIRSALIAIILVTGLWLVVFIVLSGLSPAEWPRSFGGLVATLRGVVRIWLGMWAGPLAIAGGLGGALLAKHKLI